MKKSRPLNKFVLSDEERLIEQALEAGDFRAEPSFAKTKAMLEEAAAQHLELHTAKPITIRINQLDLIRVKARAKSKQIPYQTLLGSLIHQFAEGEHDLSL